MSPPEPAIHWGCRDGVAEPVKSIWQSDEPEGVRIKRLMAHCHDVAWFHLVAMPDGELALISGAHCTVLPLHRSRPNGTLSRPADAALLIGFLRIMQLIGAAISDADKAERIAVEDIRAAAQAATVPMNETFEEMAFEVGLLPRDFRLRYLGEADQSDIFF